MLTSDQVPWHSVVQGSRSAWRRAVMEHVREKSEVDSDTMSMLRELGLQGLRNITTTSDALSPDAQRCGSREIRECRVSAGEDLHSEYQIVAKGKLLDQMMQNGLPTSLGTHTAEVEHLDESTTTAETQPPCCARVFRFSHTSLVEQVYVTQWSTLRCTHPQSIVRREDQTRTTRSVDGYIRNIHLSGTRQEPHTTTDRPTNHCNRTATHSSRLALCHDATLDIVTLR